MLVRLSRAAAAAVLLLPASLAAQSSRPVWPDEGPAVWTERRTGSDITANDLRTRLYQLADDSMMGRRVGTEGNRKGTEYIAAEFRRLGLKPAGEGGTYFQDLPYGAFAYERAATQLVVAGRKLQLETDFIPVASNALAGLGADAALANTPTVFAGRWGDTSVVLDPATFKGKVAVFVVGPSAPGVPNRPAPLLRCDSVPDRFGVDAILRTEAEIAARNANRPPSTTVRDRRAVTAGVAGVLVIALDSLTPAQRTAALQPRPSMKPTAASATQPPVALISMAAAGRIFRRFDASTPVGTAGAPVTAAWQFAWTPSPAGTSRNVIAVLPGSDPARAGEYVLVGAHNDHVGWNRTPVDHDSLRAVNTITRRQGNNDPICRPTPDQQRRIDSLIAHARSIRPARRDSIFNGADDDGSGTVVMLEIAEKFATEKPARSVIFMSHQGEEAGLLGSFWWTEHPTIPLEQIVGVFNMDMVGKGRVEQVKLGGPNSVQMLGLRRQSREFGDIIDSVNAVRSEPMAIDKTWDIRENPLNRFCRSDQVAYVRKGIPTVYLSLGYAQDYHQLTDEPQYIEYEHSARLARFVHDVMFAVAERTRRPAITGPDPNYPRC